MFKCRKVGFFKQNISDVIYAHQIQEVPTTDSSKNYVSVEMEKKPKLDKNKDGCSVHGVQAHVSDSLQLSTHTANQIFIECEKVPCEVLSVADSHERSVPKKITIHRMASKYCKLFAPLRNLEENAMGGYEESTFTFWPPPLTMITFSLIQIIIFCIAASENESNEEMSKYTMPTNNTMLVYLEFNPNKRAQVWRFLSYMLMHSNETHIIGNLIMQIFWGIPLELANSWWRVGLVYLAGVLAGSMGVSLKSNATDLNGASPGVYSLIVAHIATVIMNYREMYHPLFQLTFFLMYCSVDFYHSVFQNSNGVNDISYVSHLFGAIAGLLVGIGVLRNLKVLPWEHKLWCCAVTFFIMFLIVGSMLNILR